jgi:hypothetical protein
VVLLNFSRRNLVWSFDFAFNHAKRRNLDYKETILYARECLLNGINSIYRMMQKIDRNLRGKGYPDKVIPRDISREIEKMHRNLMVIQIQRWHR